MMIIYLVCRNCGLMSLKKYALIEKEDNLWIYWKCSGCDSTNEDSKN